MSTPASADAPPSDAFVQGSLGRRAVPGAVPDGHRVHVDLEAVAREVGPGLAVLGADVGVERRAGEVDGGLGAADEARRRSSP